MADAVAERRPALRFFCHRCLVEFEDVLQDYMCPYCESGFIEQLESEAERPLASSSDFSDADMSNIDDLTDDLVNRDELHTQNTNPPQVLDDIAFLMSGGRLRGAGTGSSSTGSGPGAGRRHTLMEELVWMIGGARPNTGALTAGAPFVLVGAPGDYVFGGEGLDAVVTQLLGQLEQAGPPPLPRERIAELPSVPVTEEQAAANIACSVCWDNFQLGETVSKLECDHIFHSSCITPWLQLHATCPICRRSLLPDTPEPEPAAPPPPAPDAPPAEPPTQPPTQPVNQTATPRLIPPHQQIRLGPRVVIRRTAAGPVTVRRFPARAHAWQPDPSSSSSSVSSWPRSGSGSSTDRDRQYNTDIDYD